MNRHLRDALIVVLALVLAFAASLIFQYIFDVREHITTVFVFAVFLVSLLTEGYTYGIVAALIGTVLVNYAFTFPYFAVDFITPVNLVSGIIMVGIAILTGALTTKLKKQEAARTEHEKERMRANLLRAVSHDLRTPLTTIYGSSTTLLENELTMRPEQREKILRGIKEDSEWLIRMVENLLSVTRLDSGQIRILKTPTVLEELVDSVVLKFKKRYPGCPLNLELPGDMILIPMDSLLVEQVLLNILDNAVQHAAGMTQLELCVTPADGRAIFEIRDNGCGIPPERLPKLFTGTYTSDGVPADGQKRNAGIGLAVCATIIHAHGGEIRAENIPTGGAVFRFSLDTEAIDHDTE